MCKEVKKKITPNAEKWLEAARRAEKHIEDLKSAVRVFKRKAKANERGPETAKREQTLHPFPPNRWNPAGIRRNPDRAGIFQRTYKGLRVGTTFSESCF